MDYETACKRHKKETEELRALQIRLISAPKKEHDRIHRNIDSKRTSIDLLERWFRFTGNKIP